MSQPRDVNPAGGRAEGKVRSPHHQGAGFGGGAPNSGKEPEGRADFSAARSLKRRLLAELSEPRAGGPLRPEDLLVRWPTDPESDPDVASLLFADYCRRWAQGDQPSLADYQERFPAHSDSLQGLFSRHELVRSLGGESYEERVRLALPSVGDEVFGFRLRQELGCGAFARVFLAEQVGLAGRPVVVKTSDVCGDEPQTLAQLQHTHIVPIYSVHEDGRAGLRAVCMPYFGGASLSRVLEALYAETPRPTRGAELVEALGKVESPKHPEPSTQRPCCPEDRGQRTEDRGQRTAASGAPETEARTPRGLLRKLPYLRAAAWVVARLAEGLQHAHERGILHRDIKPSNILLGADGQPMLLDFNLAHDQGGDPAAATLGGTVAYMAPEHLRALGTRNPALVRQVDHRSDVYGLGMVLFEMLTGHNPFDQSGSYSPLPAMIEAMAVERGRGAPSLRRRRADAPWGLESILRKCLDPDPARRYQQAEHLAEDLRRFLDDRPLRHAPELSWAERAGKWLRRHPRMASSGAVAAGAVLLLAGAGAALAGVRKHLVDTREQLEYARGEERRRAYEEGTVRALLLVNATTDLSDHTREGLKVCEQTLGLYGVLDGEDWQDAPPWRRLGAEDRRRLAEDTRELLLLLAWARARQAPGDRAVLRAALDLVARAESVRDLPPCAALLHDRARYLRQLGDEAGAREAEARARRVPPAGARDHYLLATTYVREGRGGRAKALAELDEAIVLNPRYYWSWFQRGVCHQKAGEHQLAAADFGVCVGLWPDFAWGHFNLGYAHDLAGHKDEAVRSYTSALERSADFPDAYLNRGLVFLGQQRYREALGDFDRALRLRPADAGLHAGRGMALEGLGRGGEADGAFAEAFARLGGAGVPVRHRVRCGYGFAVCRRLPGKAQEVFEQVLREEPGHPEALYGRALVAAEGGHAEEAVAYLGKAVAAAPQLMEARRHLAIQLARCGRFAEAFRAVNWCLEREPEVGATLYAGACVAARAAERSGDGPAGRELAGKALDLLRRAFARGYGRRRAGTDPDLSGVREDPEFRRLLARGPVSSRPSAKVGVGAPTSRLAGGGPPAGGVHAPGTPRPPGGAPTPKSGSQTHGR